MKTLSMLLENLKDWIAARLAKELAKRPLTEQVETFQQLMNQDLEPDPGGGGVKIREGVAEDRRVSVGDAEMRQGRKSKSKRLNGFPRSVGFTIDPNGNQHDDLVGEQVLRAG